VAVGRLSDRADSRFPASSPTGEVFGKLRVGRSTARARREPDMNSWSESRMRQICTPGLKDHGSPPFKTRKSRSSPVMRKSAPRAGGGRQRVIVPRVGRDGDDWQRADRDIRVGDQSKSSPGLVVAGLALRRYRKRAMPGWLSASGGPVQATRFAVSPVGRRRSDPRGSRLALLLKEGRAHFLLEYPNSC
jgi:hypothetical protein